MNAADTPQPLHPFQRHSRSLRANRVDVISSLMLSLLIVAVVIVGFLLIVWLTYSPSRELGTVTVDQVSVRGGDTALLMLDFAPPEFEEVEQLFDAPFSQTLEAVTDAATVVAAASESETSEVREGIQRGESRTRGPTGPLSEGDDIVPRFERWDLKFQAKDVKAYASQLDFYKIELGCIGKSKLVDYASGFSGSPQKRSGKGGDEKRLYFMWRTEGPLVAFDRQLLGGAGVATQGRQMLKFIPKELEDRLVQAEMKYANSKGHSKVKEIAKTVFESQPASSGYEFIVVEQRYRVVAE